MLLSTNLACAVTWSEVTLFSYYWGTAPYVLSEQQTGNFTSSDAEWRIVWSHMPISIADPAEVYFGIFVYRTNETNYIMEMVQQGNTTTSGTWYINNQTGEFDLKFLVYNVLNATAVIEQDVNSVPEFSPTFALSLLTAGTLAAVILARKKVRFRNRSQR